MKQNRLIVKGDGAAVISLEEKKQKGPTCSKSHACIQFAANINQVKVYICCPETQQKKESEKMMIESIKCSLSL